jgi:hypothetical protein
MLADRGRRSQHLPRARTGEKRSGAGDGKRCIDPSKDHLGPDCHALDAYFHDASNDPILEAGFILVHVNIGRLDRNLDIAKRYEIPLDKGVPALAVLDSDGKLLFSQKAGEFEAMRSMRSVAVTDFLNHWKPVAGS